jgi:steroid delta-isomerase
MLNAQERTEAIIETVNRYVELVAKGRADDLVELYADDATVQDPVGGEIHIGRAAIRKFYTTIENLERESGLVTMRVAGHEAAFQFWLTLRTGDGGMRIEPIDVMSFDQDGKVTSMKAYWSSANVTKL